MKRTYVLTVFACLMLIKWETYAQSDLQLDPALAPALSWLETGQLKKALDAANLAQSHISQTAGPASLPFAQACWLTGRCEQALARQDSAILRFEKSLAVLAQLPTGQDRYLEGMVNSALANSRSAKGRANEALDLAGQALAQIRSVKEGPSEGAALALFVLASCRVRQNFAAPAAKTDLEAALAECHAANAGQSWLAGSAHNILGYWFWKNNDFYSAMAHFKEAEGILKALNPDDNGYLATLYANMGGCLNDMYLHQSAIPFLEYSLRVFKSFDEGHPNLSIVYNSLGNAYRYTDENALAASLQKEAMATARPEKVGAYQNGLGLVWLKEENYEQAKAEFLSAIEKLEPHKEKNKEDYARPFRNLAECYFAEQDWEKAAKFAEKGLRLSLSRWGGPNHPDIARSYWLLVQCRMASGQFELSHLLLDSALQVYRNKFPGGQHGELAIAYRLKAEVYLKEKQFERCEAFADSALFATGWRGQGGFHGIISPKEFITTVQFQANFQRNRSDSPSLEKAETACRLGLGALDYFRKNLIEDQSRISSIHKHYGLLEAAISTQIALKRPQEAFLLAERTKGLGLLESIKASKDEHSSLPAALQEQISELQIKIGSLEKEQQLLSSGEMKGSLPAVEQSLLEQRQAWNHLQKTIQDEHPDIFQSKYEVDFVSLETIQDRLLQPGQTLLEYFTGDSSIFMFVVKKTDFQVVEVKKDFPLERRIEEFRQCISGKNRSTQGAKYVEIASLLFEKLIAPVQHLLTSDVVVVPDGPLSYLPFELLLAERPKPAEAKYFKDHHYLLRDYLFSYCYSATLLQEMRMKKHLQPAQKGVLAFAPWFENDLAALDTLSDGDERAGFHALPASGREVHKICRMTGGDPFYNAEATKERFIELANSYQVLHLSTHGKANDRSGDFAYLAFATNQAEPGGGLLFVQALRQLTLNADLVVLSACETGIGRLHRGEGIISLARAFTSAGAKSIVTSLWSVNDEKTQYLMVRFYVHLKAGMRKDQALRQAKLDFLQKHGNADSHPFFWAGFIAVGDMSPVRF